MADLAIVTSYFNPFGFQQRTATIKPFVDKLRPQLERVGGKLYGVELSWNGEPTLPCYGFDNAIVIDDCNAAKLFQKEQLLNIGIKQAIEDGAKYIGWFDIDVVFQRSDWCIRACEMLNKFDVIQPASSIQSMYAEGPQRPRPAAARIKRIGKVHTGGAWVAKKELLEKIGGLFPYAILGGGDWCIWGAMYNRLRRSNNAMMRDSKRFRPSILVTEDFKNAWREWASKLPSTLRVGCTHGKLTLLNHGSRKTRHYGGRHKFYKRYKPTRDLTLAPTDVFYWSPNADQEFEAVATQYMKGRQC